MRVVFMGSPSFAALVLQSLAQAHDVVCVYTNPDAVRSRGKKLTQTPVRAMAEALGLPVRTATSLRSSEEQAYLRELAPDAICVAACSMLLPQEVLDIPVHGCINVHGSLLPRWRGAAPIERAILAGDETAGISIMKMEAGLDTGPYAMTASTDAATKTADELTAELAMLGGDALVQVLGELGSGHVEWQVQDENLATYAEKLSKNELYWTHEDSAQLACRKVRASSAAHKCKVVLCGKRVDLEEVVLSDDTHGLSVGQAACIDGHVFAGFGDGVVEIVRLKPEGKGSMEASAFARGAVGLRDGAGTWEPALS